MTGLFFRPCVRVPFGLPMCLGLIAVAAFAEPARIGLGEARHRISPSFNGMNTSYFNDLEYVWSLGDVERHLREARIGALRWPGGEETSRFHWEHPGVDGYVDIWNTAHYAWTWQSVRVGQENWSTNTRFVDFERFVERCRRVGAEPIVGVNLSSGEVMDRREEGIAAAVRLVRRIREKNYPVRYLYLDNEPWHKGSYLQFPGDLYAEVYVAYARAMRAEAPELKFIASPGSSLRFTPSVRRFMEQAGEYTDYLNFHAYWEWAEASAERWKRTVPMRNSNQWIPEAESRTFDRDMQAIRRRLDAGGWETTGLVMLEWNIGPLRNPEAGTLMPPHLMALAQGEMLLQLAAADLHITALWPMFWAVRVPGFSEDLGPPEADSSSLRGPFDSFPPYRPRPTQRMFRMLRDLPGAEWIEAESSEPSLLVTAVRSPTSTVHLYVLNKSAEARVARLPAEGHTVVVDDSFDEHGGEGAVLAAAGDTVELAPWSLAHLRLVPLPPVP